MLVFKNGVSIKRATPQLVLAISVAEQVFLFHHYDCVITAGDNGVHSSGSLHPLGLAVDLRSKHIKSAQQKRDILDMLRYSLEPQFDIILECAGTDNEHYHIEYDPK